MTLHLVKLCVGCESIEDLRDWQDKKVQAAKKKGQAPTLWHRTRMFPKRKDEIVNGGSLYWVIKGVIQVRQPIVDLVAVTGDDGIARCDIVLGRELVAVRPTPRRAFQGWRYLPADEAPRDLAVVDHAAGGAMPAKLRAELAALGLL
jgi:hypothetical protein